MTTSPVGDAKIVPSISTVRFSKLFPLDRKLLYFKVVSHNLFTWANQLVHYLGKWYTKCKTGKFHRIFYQYKSRPQRPETTIIKECFEEMEHEFLLGIFCPHKQDYLFRCSIAPGNFLPERPNRLCSIYFPTRFYCLLFCLP